MSEQEVVVLDASVGVKLFREERGSDATTDLFARHAVGEIIIAVDALFFHEVLSVMSREVDAAGLDRVWGILDSLDLAGVDLDAELVVAAAAARREWGCSLYDAFSVGLADVLKAPLYSADVRAHGRHPNVRMIG